MTIQLRPYQHRALYEELLPWFAENPTGNPIVAACVGAGKSILLAELCRHAVLDFPEYRSRILMLVPSKELLEQNLAKIAPFAGPIKIGIVSASLGRKDIAFDKDVVIATIGSVSRNPGALGRLDLILIDEAHLVPRTQTGAYRKLIADCQRYNPALRVVGFTGTEFRGNGIWLTEGKDRLFTDIAARVTMRELLNEGYLSPLVTVDTGVHVSGEGVGMKDGDFIVSELAKKLDTADLTKSVADQICNLGKDRKRWLVYGATVKHATHLADAIRSRGFSAEVVSAETPKGERERLIRLFRSGDIRALVNVAVLCLDEETEILTTQGWVGIDDISFGYQVACWDNGNITFATPKNIFIRDREPNERMVVCQGHVRDIRVTEGHTIIYSKNNSNWMKDSAGKLVDANIKIPVSGNADPLALKATQPASSSSTVNARIRSLKYVNKRRGMSDEDALKDAESHAAMKALLMYKNPDELTIDECAFIGFWLGDGHLGVRCSLSQTDTYPNIVKWVDELLDRIGFTYSRNVKSRGKDSTNAIVWTIARGTGGKDQYIENGYFRLIPYLNKCGTSLFWGLNQEQLDSLLFGFWLADGNHGYFDGNTNGRARISGTQYDLYSLLQAIGSCRGYRTSITKNVMPKNTNHTQTWSFKWFKTDTLMLNRQRFSFEEEPWKPERVWCVETVTGALVSRRKNKVSILGNCAGFDVPELDLIALVRNTRSPVLYTQIMGRGLRTAEQKSDCLVLDFTDTVETLGPVDLIKGRSEPKPKECAGEAPYKICPECGASNPASALQCKSCGEAFPPPSPKINHHVSAAAVMSGNGIVEAVVHRVTYSRHQKEGKPTSLKITYWGPLRPIVNEWVCLEHSGYARAKAEGWWRVRWNSPLNLPVPRTVDAALTQTNFLRTPARVTVKQTGDWPELVRCHFEEVKPEEHEPQSLKGWADSLFANIDEAPF